MPIFNIISSVLSIPSIYSHKLNSSDILIAQQALLLGFKVRIFEHSDLFINILPFCLLSRKSSFFEHNLEKYLIALHSDRYNKEIIYSYNKEVKIQISDVLLCGAVHKHSIDFEKFNTGGDYQFESCGVADLEAEHIRLPKIECINWMKKTMMSFLAKTVKKAINTSFYQEQNPSIKKYFVNYFISEELLEDYKLIKLVTSINNSLSDRNNIFYYQNNSSMRQMKKNMLECQSLTKKLYFPFSHKNHYLDKIEINDSLLTGKILKEEKGQQLKDNRKALDN